MTLANESPTQKPTRAARDHADAALKAAAEGRWQEAADENRAVLAFAAEIKVEERIEAQSTRQRSHSTRSTESPSETLSDSRG